MQDPTKLPVDIMTDAVNEKRSGKSFNYAYGVLKFQAAQKYDPYDQNDPYITFNTTCQMTAAAEPSADDWMWIFYNRQPLSNRFVSKGARMPYKETYTTVHALLEDLNARFGINLTATEVADTAIASGSLPITVTLAAKDDALIYLGTAEITLADPATFTDDLMLPVVKYNGSVNGAFTDGSGTLLLSDNISSVGYTVSSNGELEIATAIADAVVSASSQTVKLGVMDDWNASFSIGMLQGSSKITDLYDVKLQLDGPGYPRTVLTLQENGGSYAFTSDQTNLEVHATANSESTLIQGTVSGGSLNSAFPGAVTNGANAPLGRMNVIVIATRKLGTAPALRAGVALQTISPLKITAACTTSSPTIDVSKGGAAAIDIEISIESLEKLDIGLEDDIPVEVTLDDPLYFMPTKLSSRAGYLTKTGGFLLAGSKPGTYRFTGSVMAPAGYAGAGGNKELTINLTSPTGNMVTGTATWNLVTIPQVALTSLTPPSITGDITVGSTITLNRGTFSSNYPIVSNILLLLANGVVIANNADSFVITFDQLGKKLQLLEVVTSEGVQLDVSGTESETVTASAPSILEPAISTEPVAGQSMQWDGAKFGGSQPISGTATLINAATSQVYDTVTVDEGDFPEKDFTIPLGLAGVALAIKSVGTSPAGTIQDLTPIGTVGSMPVVVTAPKINGAASVGETLTFDHGTYSGTAPMDVTEFDLYADGEYLASASESYIVQAADVGKTFTLKEVVNNEYGNLESFSVVFGPIS